MAYRSGHGNGGGVPRIEVLPVDEQPDGVPAPKRQPCAALTGPLRRGADGRFADREAAREAGRRGAAAKASKRAERANAPRIAQGLGLRDVTAEELAPYLGDAHALVEHEVARLAATVGGGTCGAGPASIVGSAALQLAGSRCAFARGDVATGSRLANDSRQNLLAAHELCAREAKSLRDHDTPRPIDRIHAELTGGSDAD
jgi:hypothetical protein